MATPSTYNIGEGEDGDSKWAIFQVRNLGSTPVRIIGGNTSCTCITLGKFPIRVDPSDTVDVTFLVKLSSRLPSLSLPIVLYTDLVNQPFLNLRIDGKVLPSRQPIVLEFPSSASMSYAVIAIERNNLKESNAKGLFRPSVSLSSYFTLMHPISADLVIRLYVYAERSVWANPLGFRKPNGVGYLPGSAECRRPMNRNDLKAALRVSVVV